MLKHVSTLLEMGLVKDELSKHYPQTDNVLLMKTGRVEWVLKRSFSYNLTQCYLVLCSHTLKSSWTLTCGGATLWGKSMLKLPSFTDTGLKASLRILMAVVPCHEKPASSLAVELGTRKKVSHERSNKTETSWWSLCTEFNLIWFTLTFITPVLDYMGHCLSTPTSNRNCP